MEVLNGNALALKACGASPDDGSIRRSKESIVFGHGLATIVLAAQGRPKNTKGYVMEFNPKTNAQGVRYWEVNADSDQAPTAWRLEVDFSEPDPDDGIHIVVLASVEGNPGQYIYLARTA